MKKIFIFVLLLLATTYPASAATTSTWQPLGWSGFQEVFFTYSSSTTPSTILSSRFAGVIKTYEWDGSSVGPLFGYGFCIEIDDKLWDGYAEEKTLADYTKLTDNTLRKVAWLFDTYWSSGNSPEENAGLQLAMWDAIYGADFTVNGKAPASPVSGVNYNTDAIFDAYDNYFSNLGSNTYTGNNYTILQFQEPAYNPQTGKYDENRQDMIFKAVPIPSTILLFGFGLLGIGIMGKKKS